MEHEKITDSDLAVLVIAGAIITVIFIGAKVLFHIAKYYGW